MTRLQVIASWVDILLLCFAPTVILVALILGLTLPKDHSVLRLGQGCYYSVTNVGPFNIQRKVCR